MAHSALVGQPAATMEDYWICKGMLQAMGKSEADVAPHAASIASAINLGRTPTLLAMMMA